MAASDRVVVMSWDVGEKNLCCYKIKFSMECLASVKSESVPYFRRYMENGECTHEFSEFLKKLAACGERILVKRIDLTDPSDRMWKRKRIISNRFLVRLSNHLEDMNEEKAFDDVDYIVIENQLKKAENNRQIQFHMRSYFLTLFLTFKPVIFFPACYKTRMFGAPRIVYSSTKNRMIKMTKYMRKKWATGKAREFMENMGDSEGVSMIYEKKGKRRVKADDESDCLLQAFAFVMLVFVDGKTELLQ